MYNTVRGTSLFLPHLGPAKVAGLVGWLDFRVSLLCETYIGRSIRAKAIDCFSEVAAFQRLGLARFHCIYTLYTVNNYHNRNSYLNGI